MAANAQAGVLHLRYAWRGLDGFIDAGTYAAADPALLGKADYLVRNGHATLTPVVTAALPDGDTRVTLRYIGTNARAIAVTVDGTDYAVPKANGKAPRRVIVAPEHVSDLLARMTFVREGA